MRRKVKIIIGLLVVLVIIITTGFMTKKWWAGADVNQNNPKNIQNLEYLKNGTIYVKIPAGITNDDLESIAQQNNQDTTKENLLKEAARKKIEEVKPYLNSSIREQNANKDESQSEENINQKFVPDVVITYVDENNKPIMPDVYAQQNNQESTASANKDLTFIWDKSWDKAPQDIVNKSKKQLQDDYPEIKKVFGNPAFNNKVKIINDPSCASMATYDAGLNQICMHITSIYRGLIAHEVAHAFHDEYVTMWDEGMAETVAYLITAESALNWSQYEIFNRPDINYGNARSMYTTGAGTWLKIYIEDPSFFLKFNPKLYKIYKTNPQNYEQGQYELNKTLTELKPKMEGELFPDWYRKQYTWQAYDIYEKYRLGSQIRGNELWIYYAYFGNDTFNDKNGVRVEIYDFNNNLIDTELVNYDSNIQYYPLLNLKKAVEKNSQIQKGRFRIELKAKAESKKWKLFSTNYFFYDKETQLAGKSIYGVVDTQNKGTIEITPRSDLSLQPISIPVENGIFATDAFLKNAGIFKLTYFSPDKKIKKTKFITKFNKRDAYGAHYFTYFMLDNNQPQAECDINQIEDIYLKYSCKSNENTNIYIYINSTKEFLDYNFISWDPCSDKLWGTPEIKERPIYNLKSDTDYFYRYIAVDFDGNSSASETKTFHTKPASNPWPSFY